MLGDYSGHKRTYTHTHTHTHMHTHTHEHTCTCTHIHTSRGARKRKGLGPKVLVGVRTVSLLGGWNTEVGPISESTPTRGGGGEEKDQRPNTGPPQGTYKASLLTS